MSLTLLVALMPGGFLFLFCWVFWRAFGHQWRLAQATAAAGQRPSALRLLSRIHVRYLWREARVMSGRPAPM